MIQKKILVIDDEDFILSIVSELLNSYGYWVATAKYAKMATIQAADADLIILDLGLGEEGDRDGGKLLSRLWENTACVAPVIVYSGLLHSESAKESLNAITNEKGNGRTIYRCIDKGQGIQKLIDAVNSYFESSPGPLVSAGVLNKETAAAA